MYKKTNRVDIKARDAKGEIILVEIQFARQHYFLQRMLYATSKTIVEHMHKGFPYERVPKVYSVNILYFLLGTGPDYIYHGRTDFIGMNTNDHLKIKPMEKKAIRNMEAYEVFPGKRKAYDDFIDELRYQHGVAMAAREEMLEMEQEKGRKKGLKEIAAKLMAKGFSDAEIIDITGLQEWEM